VGRRPPTNFVLELWEGGDSGKGHGGGMNTRVRRGGGILFKEFFLRSVNVKVHKQTLFVHSNLLEDVSKYLSIL
jgi:hypothetical protein